MKKYLLFILLFVFAISSIFSGVGCKKEEPIEAVEEEAVEAESAEEEAAEEIEEEIQEKITLRFWHHDTTEGGIKGMDEMVAKYEAENPNIDIVLDTQDYTTMLEIVQTALGAGTGPEILQYDISESYAGVLVDAGYLIDLEKYYEEMGWNERIYDWTKERTNFGGKTYGLAIGLEYIPVFYNKGIFEELDLDVPNTYEELIEICDATKAAGYIPFAFGDSEKWPAFHPWEVIAYNIAGKEKIYDMCKGDASWNDPDIVKSIQLWFVDMNEADYFPMGAVSMSYFDANPLFFNGEAAMLCSGTWQLGDIISNMGDEADLFLFPSIDNKPVTPTGSLGSAYYITSLCEHPDEAAEFLDFLYSEENTEIWVSTMALIPPYDFDVEAYDLPSLTKEVIKTLTTVEMAEYINFMVSGEMNNTIFDSLQSVLIGEMTPEEFAAKLQEVKEAEMEAQ